MSLCARGSPLPLAVPLTRARRLWPPCGQRQRRRPRRWFPRVRGAPRRRRVGRRRRLRPSRAALRRGPRGWEGRREVWAPLRPRARRRPPRGLAGRRRRHLPRRPAPPSQVARPLRRPEARQLAGRARPTPRPRAGSRRRREVKQPNRRVPPRRSKSSAGSASASRASSAPTRSAGEDAVGSRSVAARVPLPPSRPATLPAAGAAPGEAGDDRRRFCQRACSVTSVCFESPTAWCSRAMCDSRLETDC